MKTRVLIAITFAISLLSGCAHQIQLNPSTTQFKDSPNKVDYVVGYHISDENRKKMVKTPGGGGDKVTYAPYKDTESVLYTVLSNKFKDVYLVKSLDDDSFIKDNEIKFVFIPEIITSSSSDSFVTWPPTKFIVDLTVKAVDSSGSVVWSKKINTTGSAEFDEFKSDFSLSARRATEKAFLELASEIENEQSLSN